ncbi:MAG: DUF447 family protein [Thiothrix sp.]|nr:DUF447 family protein [Thiothrix sp.]
MIFETIVITRNVDGSARIAPLGVRREADGLLVLAPFHPSGTLDNLRREGYAVVNTTTDVRVFAGCLTGRHDWPLRPAEQVSGFVLQQALAHSELEVVRVQEDAVRPAFHCREVLQQTHAAFPGFNRAQAAVLEAAILVSRLQLLDPEKIRTELAYLQVAIDKTAGPDEREAWGWLLEKVALREGKRPGQQQGRTDCA